MGTPTGKGTTRYSARIDGDTGNHGRPVRFDLTDGYLGITTWVFGKVERVLLSPGQVKKLLAFLKDPGRTGAAG